MKATYTQLKDGKWGIKVLLTEPGESIHEGETVQVTLKDGRVKAAVVNRIIWRGMQNNSPAVLAKTDDAGGKQQSAATPAKTPVAGRCPHCGRSIAVMLSA